MNTRIYIQGVSRIYVPFWKIISPELILIKFSSRAGALRLIWLAYLKICLGGGFSKIFDSRGNLGTPPLVIPAFKGESNEIIYSSFRFVKNSKYFLEMSVRKRKYSSLTVSLRKYVQNHDNKPPILKNQEVVDWVFKTFEGLSEEILSLRWLNAKLNA